MIKFCLQRILQMVLHDSVIGTGVFYQQVHTLKLALEGVEKERDFYFGKLREIELLCQEHGQENNDLVQRLMEVLYASEEHVSSRYSGVGSKSVCRSPFILMLETVIAFFA